jgi:hypothetical protein
MRNIIFLWIASALLIITGCTKNEIDNEQPNPETEGRTLVMTASVPNGAPQTRLNLEPDIGTKNIIVKWKVNDVINFFFEQGTTLLQGTPVTLTSQNISEDGKKASFIVTIPTGPGEINIGYPFTIYALHGAPFVLDQMNGKINVNVSPVGFSLLSELNNVPVSGEVTITPPLGQISIYFNHLGVLQCLNFKNSSAADIVITPTLVNEGGTTWYYTYSGGTTAPHYDLIGQLVTDVTVTPSSAGTVTIPAGSTVQLAQWVMPKSVNTPEIKLNALAGGGTNYVSENSKPARSSAMQEGSAYHLYALWDGSKLYFTDNAFTPPPPPPTGDLMHADGGSDFIGVVYSKSGNVYYNSTQDGNTWSGETLLGAGTEARIAIDGTNKPHVVFTTGGKIAYTKYDGSSWSALVYIETNYSGSCSKPDIDVDGSGYAHVTYTDTKGNTGDPYDHPDIMYAQNTTGAFQKTLIYNGWREYYDQIFYQGFYYEGGSCIAVDGAGNYYIIAPYRNWQRSGRYTDQYYYIAIKTPSASANSGSTNGCSVFDLEYDGYNVIALYKDSNGNRTAIIQESPAAFISANNITATLSPHSLSHNCEVAGLSGSYLFAKYLVGGISTETVYSDITVKSSTKVAAVNKVDTADRVYAVYTDNTGSEIKVKEITTSPAI